MVFIWLIIYVLIKPCRLCADNPVHLSPLIDKFKYKDHYGTEFGGVTMLKTEQG